MEDMIRLKIIDEIARSSGYDIALMTTFNFDVSFFERAILNQMNAQNIKKITLFVDSKEFTKSISEISSCSIGRKYMVSPMRISGAFHPKLILLLGEDKAKLFVGSANLTTSGYSLNNELFNIIQYSSKAPECIDVINDAIDFFLGIYNISYQLDNSVIEEVKQLPYYHRTKPNGKVRLIHNLEISLLDQLTELIKDPVRDIRIAVPYYDNALTALERITAAFPEAETVLYLQDGRSAFPEQVYAASGMNVQTLVYEGVQDSHSNSRYNFYHGKAFLFRTDNKAYIAYGSANCTQAALTKTYVSEGNIECVLVGIGSIDEFDYFFHNFEIQDNAELNTQPLIISATKTSHFNYKFGEITDDGIRLYVNSPDAKNPLAILGDEKLTVYSVLNEITITIPLELAADLPEIFEITIKDGDVSETLRCWTFSLEALNAHRQKYSDKYSLETFEYDSENDKYIQDRINLMNAETMCLPEIQEHNKRIAYLNQMKQEQEEDSNDDDYIVDVEILEEYKKSYKQLNMVNRIRGLFLKQLLSNSWSLFSNRKQESKTVTEQESEVHQHIQRATTEEKRFERFVKSRIKGMTNKSYIDIITTEHYLGLVAVILEIFTKYQDVDIFDGDFVSETRCDLFTAILTKEKDENNKEIEDMLLRDSFYILMDNYINTFRTDSMEKKEYLNSINKKLLQAMEKRFSIRSSYKRILDSIAGTLPDELKNYSKSSFYKYIEDLFGYKNYDLLVEFVKALYDDAEVEQHDDIMRISGKAKDMKKEFRPNQSLLKEIGKYSRAVLPIKIVTIKIESSMTDTNNSIIKEIEHVVNYRFHNGKSTIVYTNGKRLEEREPFIDV